jgi:hypothetical protein
MSTAADLKKAVKRAIVAIELGVSAVQSTLGQTGFRTELETN